jgi:hypothetical protein
MRFRQIRSLFKPSLRFFTFPKVSPFLSFVSIFVDFIAIVSNLLSVCYRWKSGERMTEKSSWLWTELARFDSSNQSSGSRFSQGSSGDISMEHSARLTSTKGSTVRRARRGFVFGVHGALSVSDSADASSTLPESDIVSTTLTCAFRPVGCRYCYGSLGSPMAWMLIDCAASQRENRRPAGGSFQFLYEDDR